MDNQKRPKSLSLENAMETAALFTLSGANCVVLNRWASSFHANATMVKMLYGSMVEKKVGVSDALGIYRKSTYAPRSAGSGSMAGGKGKKGDATPKGKGKPQTPEAGSEQVAEDTEGNVSKTPKALKLRVQYNTIVVGLPHLTMTA